MGSSYTRWQLCEDMACYTPVPYYRTYVSCGLPNEFGDVPAEEILVPSILLSNLKVFVVDAGGDSMEGARIFDGDPLLIEKTRHYEVGNIVLAMVDGQQLIKTYYVDDLGRHWLGPCRVLMDCGFIPKERYDLFCEMVCYVLPEHKHLPCDPELRRSAVGCFSKPFATWTDEKAPVNGKSYQGYYDAGEVMLKKLP